MFESMLTFMYLPLIMLVCFAIIVWISKSISKQLMHKYEAAKHINDLLVFITKHKFKYATFWIVLFGFIAFMSVSGNNATTTPIEKQSFQTQEDAQRMKERTEQLMNNELISNDSLQESVEKRKKRLEEYRRSDYE